MASNATKCQSGACFHLPLKRVESTPPATDPIFLSVSSRQLLPESSTKCGA